MAHELDIRVRRVTNLSPTFGYEENALEFDEEEDDVVARFSLSMANSEKADFSLRSLKIFRT